MKFLCVGTTPWRGGTETHFVALATALAQAGHLVTALVCADSFIARGCAGTGVDLQFAQFRNAADPVAFRGLLWAVRRSRPDWLVGDFGKEYWPLLLAGRLRRVPVALFHHRAAPMRRHSTYWVPRLAARFFVPSDFCRDAWIARGAPAARVLVSRNPVDVDACRPDAESGLALRRSALGLDGAAVVVGFAGRILRTKGAFVLFAAASAAMAIEPRLHCAWIGEGADLGELRSRIAEGPFAPRHHVLGWIEDVAPYYRALSILAVPSLTPEPFGRVSIEAQACGIPVLVSGHSGLRETVVPGMGGRLLPAGDVAAWRDAILALRDADLRARMGHAGRDFVVRRFSSRTVARQFVATLHASPERDPPAAP